MIFQRTAQQESAWKNEMRNYQKGKRTKKPFGQSLPTVNRVTYQEVKSKQTDFHPILQTFKRSDDQVKVNEQKQINRVKSLMNHIKNVQKYQKQYDIINLCSNQELKTEKGQNKKLGPIRNAYNVINNQKLPQFFFKGRQVNLPVERQMKLLDYHKKQFDIVTGLYKENNQEKKRQQEEIQRKKIEQKYSKTHTYDPVYGKFYDQQKQKQYQNQVIKKQVQHGKDFQKRFPPSYVYRQPLILDYSKALPQSLQTLDQKNQQKKKKYQLKYIVQEEYEQRNMQQQEKHEQIIKNRVHYGRILDQKAKQFDIITNKNYKSSRAEELYRKKPKIESWDEFLKDSKPASKFIKTSGFNE